MGRPATAALAAMLLLSGCAGLGADGPTETLTPPPVPDATASGTGVAQLPPGVDERGVSRPAALIAAHRAALDDTAYTLRLRYVERYANGTLRARETWLNRYEPDGSARTVTVQNFSAIGLSAYRADTWSNGSVVVSRLANQDGISYFRPGEHPYPLSGSRQLFGVFLRGAFDVARADEPAHTRLSLSAVEGDRPLVGPFTFTRAVRTNPRNVSAELLVTPRGLVRRYRIAYDTSVDGDRVHVVLQVAFEDIGTTTVQRPAWVGRALARTNATG